MADLTRRDLLARAAAGASLATLARGALPAAAAPAARPAVPLPSPAQVREDITRMVRFGPRLTASQSHADYVAWLEEQFAAAGLDLLPCDRYETDRWLAQRTALDVLDGPGAGPADLAAYYPRSRQTPEAGVTGPLVYGGAAPALSVSGADLGALQAAVARYPAEVAAWAAGLAGTLAGGAQDAILLVDLPVPAPLTAAAFLPLATHLHWAGHTVADWAAIDYKRIWIEPGLGIPLAPFQALGAAGVVFVVDASAAALRGGYLPFTHGFEPLPAAYVDRDEGRRLRALAGGRPRARLTLTATRERTPTQAVTAVLPGASDETLIFNTHTDGQGFAEENGGVAFVHLARHFASRPKADRLRRTLVFACWPGHMVADLPQTQGWIDAHPDLVARAAAALTVEHLGCSEWVDTVDRGYHATGEAELLGVWTTQGRMFELTRDSVVAHDVPRAALLRPPVQFGVGGAFQSAGVPQIGAIAGPEYLLTVSDDGDLDKLDERLAARQIAWLADLAGRIDDVPRDELRAGDPTLGGGGPAGPRPAQVTCGPAVAGVTARWYGRRRRDRGAVVALDAEAPLDAVTVQLRRGGRVVAERRLRRVPAGRTRLVLRRARRRRFATGAYVLVVRAGGEQLVRRAVRIGRPPRAAG